MILQKTNKNSLEMTWYLEFQSQFYENLKTPWVAGNTYFSLCHLNHMYHSCIMLQ